MIYDLQKASMWKRISAFLFDGILLGIIAVLFALVISWISGYDHYVSQVNDAFARYGEQFQVELPMNDWAVYEALDETKKQNVLAAYEALNADAQAVHASRMMDALIVPIISLGPLMGFLIMEFMIPMLFKNGQTLGKKIFGIAVMHTSGVKISGPMLFARTVLGKYAVETMVPLSIILMILNNQIGIVAPIILLLLLILQAGVMIGTHTNSMIHDLLAKTVTVDMGSQMIFESQEALIAYKEKIHAEKAAKEAY